MTDTKQLEMDFTEEQKIDPRALSFSEFIYLFRASGYINFQRFQTDLYDGTLELYYE